MNTDAVGPPAEVHMTVQVTRKDTGRVDTYRLVGRQVPAPTPTPQPTTEELHGHHPYNSGA